LGLHRPIGIPVRADERHHGERIPVITLGDGKKVIHVTSKTTKYIILKLNLLTILMSIKKTQSLQLDNTDATVCTTQSHSSFLLPVLSLC